MPHESSVSGLATALMLMNAVLILTGLLALWADHLRPDTRRSVPTRSPLIEPFKAYLDPLV